MKRFFRSVGSLAVASYKGFGDDKVTKLSGSLAYSTVFSMAPLLILIISISGIFFGAEAIEGKVYGTLAGFMGHDTAVQLQEIIKKASLSGKSSVTVVIGAITLLLGATAIFGEIQDSINTIWGLKAKPKRGFLKMLRNRFLSFSLIVSLGFLLLVSLVFTSLIDEFSKHLQVYFPQVTLWVVYALNQLITLSVVTLIFGMIYKVLPDAKIRFRDVFAGALTTGVLFMIGKFAISIYLAKSSPGSIFGPAAAIVIILLWTYYSSLILYFGAEFTKAYAVKYGKAIHPNDYAVTIKEVTIEQGSKTIQEKEKEKKVEKEKQEQKE